MYFILIACLNKLSVIWVKVLNYENEPLESLRVTQICNQISNESHHKQIKVHKFIEIQTYFMCRHVVSILAKRNRPGIPTSSTFRHMTCKLPNFWRKKSSQNNDSRKDTTITATYGIWVTWLWWWSEKLLCSAQILGCFRSPYCICFV